MTTWKKIIVSGSDAHLNSLNVAASVTADGNISGSATSTGSFGTIKVDDITKVTNLNADLLDGQTGTYYTDFSNQDIDDGEIPIAKLAQDAVTVDAGDGLKTGGSVTLGSSVTLNIYPIDFAGTGLEDDGSENLRLTTQGAGLFGGHGSLLSVDSGSMAAYFSSSAFSTITGDVLITDAGVSTIQATSVENSMLAGSIANAKLSNSSVNYGGIILSLGGSDTTPAFNLSDATALPIVAGTTGTLSVARGGTGAATLNNLITLGTHTTGNYVATLTGGTGITSSGATSGEGITHSISVVESEIDHNTLDNYDPDEHIDWTSASINLITSGHINAAALSGSLEHGLYDGNGISDFTFDNSIKTPISVQAVTGHGIDVVAGGIEIEASDIAGEGLAVDANDTWKLDLQNYSNLTGNTILKWAIVGSQLTDSIITDNGTTVTIGGNLVVNGDTTTISTSTLEVGDAFVFAATGSATSNVDGGLIIQSGSAADSGSAIFHDIDAQRWGVATGVSSTTSTIGGDASEKKGDVTTVNALELGGNIPSTIYVGVGEMQIDTSTDDVWILTSA